MCCLYMSLDKFLYYSVALLYPRLSLGRQCSSRDDHFLGWAHPSGPRGIRSGAPRSASHQTYAWHNTESAPTSGQSRDHPGWWSRDPAAESCERGPSNQAHPRADHVIPLQRKNGDTLEP